MTAEIPGSFLFSDTLSLPYVDTQTYFLSVIIIIIIIIIMIIKKRKRKRSSNTRVYV